MARLIDRLEARGMVERRPDPKDRRIRRLHLLPDAYPVLRKIDDQRTEITRMLSAGLDRRTLDATTKALIAMKATLTARRAEPEPAPDPVAEEAA